MYNLLFILIGAVLTSNEVKADCRMITLFSLQDPNCHKKLSPEAKDILEANPFSDNEEILQFHTCSLHNKNFLAEGKFHRENMEDLMNRRILSDKLKRRLQRRFKDIIEEGINEESQL